MNILFFLEPSIEFNDPLFRYQSLKNSIIPQVDSLMKYNDNVVIILSSVIAKRFIEDGLYNINYKFAVIDPLEWMSGEDYNKRAYRLMTTSITDIELDRIEKIIRSSLPKDFEPEMVISWESPTPFFKKIFKRAKIYSQLPGIFSRPPYPMFISMYNDTLDNLQQSNITLEYRNIINNFDISKFRRNIENTLYTTFPLHSIIDTAKKQFDKLILFPLQVDNYFMVNTFTKNKTQFEILQMLLSKIPSNIGIIITNYITKDIKSNVLSTNTFNYLKTKYQNIIYREELNHVYCSSQFIVSHVDGVVTISSSVGYQAAFFKKPLFTIGESHISIFSTANTIEEFVLQLGNEYNRDQLIKNIILKNNFPLINYHPKQLYNWIHSFINDKLYTNWLGHSTLEDWLNANVRDIELTRSLDYFGKIKNKTTMYHCAELSEQIRKHDIISFDIFDTLLIRPFMKPHDLFLFMQQYVKKIVNDNSFDFFYTRILSEQRAFSRAIAKGEEDITIDDIYYNFIEITNLPYKISMAVKYLEIELEKKFLYRRNSGYSAYLEAKQLNKTIIITSDMYLHEHFLKSILHINGYHGYDKIYVSSSYKLKKRSGNLYKQIIDDYKISPEKILHVGDNLKSDIICAKKIGIHAFHLPSCMDKFINDKSCQYERVWARDKGNHSLSWRMILSIIGNWMYDNPYLPHRRGTLFDGIPERLGFCGFGPLLFGFTKWLCEAAIENNIDRLYFLSRDGKIMKDAYDIISKHYYNSPKSYYLYCSRRSVNLSKCRTLSDIYDLVEVDFAHRMLLSDFLYHRFGIHIAEINSHILTKYNYSNLTRITSSDIPTLKKFFKEIQNIILNKSKIERNNYIEYIRNCDFLLDGNIAIVDIGYNGTMQESIYNIIKQKKKILGFYLITFRDALFRLKKCNNLQYYSYLADSIDRHDTYHPFCKHVPLYEILFSGTETSFIKIIKDYNNENYMIYMPKSRNEENRINIVKQIQSGALYFINTSMRIFGRYIKSLDIESFKSLRLLGTYFDNPHATDAKILSNIIFEDQYGGGGNKIVLPDLNNFIGNCIWKEGFNAVLDEINKSGNKIKKRQKIINILIHIFYKKILSGKMLSKFERNPASFFHDSKSKLCQYLGKIYLKT